MRQQADSQIRSWRAHRPFSTADMKFAVGDQKLHLGNPVLFGIWRALKRLRLIHGKAKLFSRQDGQI
jgi:hypothetical protein